MGILLILIGLCFVLYGLFKFVQFLFVFGKILWVPFMKEKQLDEHLFTEMKKESDYQGHEKAIDSLFNSPSSSR